MKSKPLKMIIANTINYYKNKGKIWENGKYIEFNYKDKGDINKVVNLVISDIDNVLRFKLKNYFEDKAYRDMIYQGYTIIYKVEKEKILILEIFKWQNK